jgi:uncharacterized protein YqeY
MGSPLLDALLADVKMAMKSQNQGLLSALRMLHSQVKDATVNVGKEASDEMVATIVAKAIKQRQDSVEQYRAAARQDLADKEQQEIEWFRKYQPQQLGQAEIEALVKTIIAETGASGKKDLGKVMQALMPKVKGRSDGKLVNQVVLAQLG